MSGSPVKGTKRQVKALLRNQQRRKTDAEVPELEGAAVLHGTSKTKDGI